MNKRSIAIVLMPIVLSACASTNDTKTADNSEDKVYVTGSHIARKSADTSASAQSVTGQQATDLMRSSVPNTAPGH